MKKIALILLLLALTLPGMAMEEVPPPGALVFDGGVNTALFLPDGRVCM